MRALTSVYSVFVEAWAEFRVYRARVLMSIVGVAVAIMALTAIAAISAVSQQAVLEQIERGQGRSAMLNIQSPVTDKGEQIVDPGTFSEQIRGEFARYGIHYWSRQEGVAGMVEGLPPESSVSATLIDPSYATMFRTRVVDGSWFVDGDADRLVPGVVIDQGMWRALGSPDLRAHPVIHLLAPADVDAVVIGVVAGGDPRFGQLWMLYDAYQALHPVDANGQDQNVASWLAWVPPAHAAALKERLASDLSRLAGHGATTQIFQQDFQSQSGADPLIFPKIIGGAAAGLILLLGALGLLNISMVTVRARIREIGIRRSFGATAGRVFAGVMMESVVATAVAGVVGVMVAILALENPLVAGFLRQAGLQDVPAFPLSAAGLGMLVAVGVGALAGLLPALVAVRVKPIDAIRF